MFSESQAPIIPAVQIQERLALVTGAISGASQNPY